MIKQTTLLLLSLAPILAWPFEFRQPAEPVSTSVPYFRAGFDNGEAHEMTLRYVNTGSVPATVTFQAFDPSGNPITVPYAAQGGGVTNLQSARMEVAAHGVGVLKTSAGSSKFQRGWLRVTSNPPGAVELVAYGWTQKPNAENRLAFTLHSQSGAPTQLIGPFVNGQKDQFLVANNSKGTDQLTFVALSRNGEEMCRASLRIAPAQFYKQPLSQYLPCTTGKSGSLQVHSETGRSSAAVFIIQESGEVFPLEPNNRTVDRSLTQLVQEFIDKMKKAAGL